MVEAEIQIDYGQACTDARYRVARAFIDGKTDVVDRNAQIYNLAKELSFDVPRKSDESARMNSLLKKLIKREEESERENRAV